MVKTIKQRQKQKAGRRGLRKKTSQLVEITEEAFPGCRILFKQVFPKYYIFTFGVYLREEDFEAKPKRATIIDVYARTIKIFHPSQFDSAKNLVRAYSSKKVGDFRIEGGL